nr:hypothetical protein GCM10025699_45130 [Microbacterium flavescens]
MANGTNDKPSVKQQRDARRQEKVAALKKQQERARRNRLIGIVTASVAGAAVVALVVAYVVTSGQPRQDPQAIEIDGVQTYSDLTANHVAGAVDYAMTPRPAATTTRSGSTAGSTPSPSRTRTPCTTSSTGRSGSRTTPPR